MTRYRTLGALDSTAKSKQEARYTSCTNPSAWVETGSQFLYPVGEIVRMYDEVIPQFYKRRAKGEVFFNPMFREHEICTRSSGGRGNTRRLNTSSVQCGNIFYNPENRDVGNQVENLFSVTVGQSLAQGRSMPLPDLFGSDINSLLIEHSTKVLSERGRADSNLWEALAEANKTVGLLSGILESTADVIRKGRTKAKAKSAANAYLAYRYGLKPLMQDAAAVIEGLQKKVGLVRKTSRSRGSETRNFSGVKTYVSATTQTVNIGYFDTDSFEVRAMSLDEYVATSLSNIGFSSKDLLTLPWELVRYSHVADWFVNVGDLIGSLTPTFNCNQLGSALVTERVRTRVITVLSSFSGSDWTILEPAAGTYSRTLKTRHRTSSLLSPGLVVKSDFRLSNLTRCLDAIALILQRIR